MGVARGCTGCTCTPRAEEKQFGPNLHGKVVSAPPGRECTPEAEQAVFEKIRKIWAMERLFRQF